MKRRVSSKQKMNIEILISTLNQKDPITLIKQMNIKSNALIINQCDRNEYKEFIIDNNIIRIIYSKERGLSKSRNLAIKNSSADICVIADDDVVYDDKAIEIIIDAYNKYQDADLIAFDVPSTNSNRQTRSLKEGRVCFLKSMRISSFQITFKREALLAKNIFFNELFGSGSRYTCGEENILLAECLKKGSKMYYVSKRIGIVHHKQSQWYTGQEDPNILKARGAAFYAMNQKLSLLLLMQFSIRKRKLFHDLTMFEAFKYMYDGLREYKAIKNNNHQ